MSSTPIRLEIEQEPLRLVILLGNEGDLPRVIATISPRTRSGS
jgi:hypothetical protein